MNSADFVSKKMSWAEAGRAILEEKSKKADQIGSANATSEVIGRAVNLIGKSESMIRRYVVTYKAIDALVDDFDEAQSQKAFSLPFATAEYIGRLGRNDPKAAKKWLRKAITEGIKVEEMKAAYQAVRSDQGDPYKLSSHMKRWKVMTKATQSLVPSLSTSKRLKQIDFPLAGPFILSGIFAAAMPKSLEDLPTTELVAGTFLISRRQDAPEPTLNQLYGGWIFTSRYFDEYWIVIPENEQAAISAIKPMHEVFGLPHVGIATVSVSDHEADAAVKKILVKPNHKNENRLPIPERCLLAFDK